MIFKFFNIFNKFIVISVIKIIFFIFETRNNLRKIFYFQLESALSLQMTEPLEIRSPSFLDHRIITNEENDIMEHITSRMLPTSLSFGENSKNILQNRNSKEQISIHENENCLNKSDKSLWSTVDYAESLLPSNISLSKKGNSNLKKLKAINYGDLNSELAKMDREITNQISEKNKSDDLFDRSQSITYSSTTMNDGPSFLAIPSDLSSILYASSEIIKKRPHSISDSFSSLLLDGCSPLSKLPKHSSPLIDFDPKNKLRNSMRRSVHFPCKPIIDDVCRFVMNFILLLVCYYWLFFQTDIRFTFFIVHNFWFSD